MKIRYLKAKQFFLAGLAALLGINVSCDKPMEEYGCPVAEFELKGKVQDPSGNPVQGIVVQHEYVADTTDADGNYALPPYYAFPGAQIELQVTDADGAEHGLYRDTTVVVPINDSEYQGGDGEWDQGTLAKTINLTVTPANEQK